MRYALYIMIGMGSAIGLEVKGNVLSYPQRAAVIATWPVVASFYFFKDHAKEPKS